MQVSEEALPEDRCSLCPSAPLVPASRAAAAWQGSPPALDTCRDTWLVSNSNVSKNGHREVNMATLGSRPVYRQSSSTRRGP